MSNEISFKERRDFRKWLEQADLNSEGVWLIFSKTDKIKSITANEALEEALCFGWIDGLIKRIDDEKYKKYFSPRIKGSSWSARNKKIVSKLMENNQISKNGLLVIERSKKDGSWDSNDDNRLSEEKFQMFESKIVKNKEAAANYFKMAKSVRKQFAGLYFEPKNEDTRNKRLLELIDLLERNIKPMDKYSKK
ncbi:MAG: YdeI/OmpD-associated family protein [Spirochaetes bacterium]|nr:YdeI/OmpD-associated family protein [Spirochaetota bacterium]